MDELRAKLTRASTPEERVDLIKRIREAKLAEKLANEKKTSENIKARYAEYMQYLQKAKYY